MNKTLLYNNFGFHLFCGTFPNKMIRTAFALIANTQGRVLLIQEGFQPAYGKWCLPGGHINENEAPELAARREAEEETGGLIIKVSELLIKMVIDNSEYAGKSDEDGMQIELNVFKAAPVGGSIAPENLTQELDVKWFSAEEVNILPLRWEWLGSLIEQNIKKP